LGDEAQLAARTSPADRALLGDFVDGARPTG
jgi:hypothetical protein